MVLQLHMSYTKVNMFSYSRKLTRLKVSRMRWSVPKLRRPPGTFRLTEMILLLNLLFRARGRIKFLLLMLTAVNLGVSGTPGKLNNVDGSITLLPSLSPDVVSPFCCRAARPLTTTSITTFSSTCIKGISSITRVAPATRSKVSNTLMVTYTH